MSEFYNSFYFSIKPMVLLCKFRLMFIAFREVLNIANSIICYLGNNKRLRETEMEEIRVTPLIIIRVPYGSVSFPLIPIHHFVS